MAGEVGSLGTAILQLASGIRTLGNDYYKADEAWNKFPGQVKSLEEKLDFWETECRNRGLSSDAALLSRLSEARTSLEKEERELKKRVGSGRSGWLHRRKARMKSTLFPATVGQSIQAATAAFDAIPEMLRSRLEGKEALDRTVMSTAVSDVIKPDPRYVPLKDSEDKICEALNNTEGPPVVVLYGPPGFGKSTVARSILIHYYNLSMGHREETRMFDLVFFLNCGPGAKVEDTHLEIIRRLGSRPESQDSLQDAEKQLRALLNAQKILLILDDVNDGDFLNKIVSLCGANVKCLVTSQRADLCKRILSKDKYIDIEVQAVDQEMASRILASHLELPNGEIPTNLKELADKMIHETECIPLAVSSLASFIVIDPDQPDDPDVWEDASTHFFEALRKEVKTTVLDANYVRSFWASMGLAIGSLNEDAKKLLLLTHACRGPLVREEILQLLWRSIKFMGVLGSFSIAKSELVSRQLIKITTSSNEHDKEKNWAMHSLQRRFIEVDMKDQRDSMFASLPRKDEVAANCKQEVAIEEDFTLENNFEDVEEKMVTAVCVLYLDGEFGERAALKMSSQTGQAAFFGHYKFKSDIEPITFLLGRLESGRWNKTARDYAMKVFLVYVWKWDLYWPGIFYMLDHLPSDSGSSAMLKTLKGMIMYRARRPVCNETGTRLMKTLVNQLEESVESGRQIVALEILDNIWNDSEFRTGFLIEPETKRLSRRSVLDETLKLLRTASNPKVQGLCATLLGNLALVVPGVVDEIPNNTTEIPVDLPVVLDELVNLLSKDDNSVLQEAAMRTTHRIAKVASQQIVKYASTSCAGIAFKCLVHVLNHRGLLRELVRLLTKDANPSMQRDVVGALHYLVKYVDQNRATIVNYPGSVPLKELARLLCHNERGYEDTFLVVRLFGSLARVQDSSSRITIATTEGVIGRLITLLAPHNTRYGERMQKYAIVALTLLDPTEGNKHRLHCGRAYRAKAEENWRLGMHTQALADLEMAESAYQYHNMGVRKFRRLRAATAIRAKANDFKMAMAHLEEEMSKKEYELQPFHLVDRGVLKRMMGNLVGALEDLDKGLELGADKYSTLKHRGYVKFLLNNEDGARADAEWALRIKPYIVDCDGACRKICLSISSVEYLEYKLK